MPTCSGLQNNQSAHSSGKYAKLEEKMFGSATPESISVPKSLKENLERLCLNDRAPFETDILSFWKMNKIKNEEMTDLANVVLAVPPTQVSVERGFSSLSLVLTKQRSKLSKESINDILLVKLNEHILDELQSV